VRFGTSGVRALVSDLSPEICGAFVDAFLVLCKRGPVLIGYDLRPSSPAIAQACARAALRRGFTPVNAGVVPTPALAFAGQCQGAPAIMVTGSHIPFDRNGIKFFRPEGEISKDDEQLILAAALPRQDLPDATLPETDHSIAEDYQRRYVDAFGPGSLQGLTLGIYEHSSAGRDMLHSILRALGAKTVGLARSDAFIPVDTEAVREEDRATARDWSDQHRFDAILTTDGDADRPLIADETGHWLRGDIVGILAAKAIGARCVVTPVSSNTALEASGEFTQTIRTRIGSPHVIAAMSSAGHKPVAGYEANGGFLLGSDVTLNGHRLASLKTRDAVLPMILLLRMARAAGCGLSALVKTLPARHTFSDRLQNVNIAACRDLLASLAQQPAGFSRLGRRNLPAPATIDLTDGVRATLESGDILHLRLSGNAPELRCYAESSTAERAAALCNECLDQVSDMTRSLTT
jgi:phosphomannomutase